MDNGHTNGGAAAERARSRQTLMYGGILVVVALMFILLSFFMNRRNEREAQTMFRENAAAQSKIEQFQTDNVILRSENERLKSELDALLNQLTELENQLRAQTKLSDEEYKRLQTAYNILQEQLDALTAPDA